MKWILRKLAWSWEWVRDLNTVLHPCRFSALMFVAGVALLFCSQGQEFTLRLGSEGIGKSIWFQFWVFGWSFQSWYWARTTLDLTFGSDRSVAFQHPRPQRMGYLVRLTPRVIGMGSYLLAFVACFFSAKQIWGNLIALLVIGCLFCLFLVYRKEYVHRFVEKSSEESRGWKERLLLKKDDGKSGYSALPLFSKFIYQASLIANALMTMAVIVTPVGVGWLFGAAAIPFVGFSLLVPLGSFLVLRTSKGGSQHLGGEEVRTLGQVRGYPVIGFMLLLALGLSYFSLTDNHGIARLTTSAAPGTSTQDFFRQWWQQVPKTDGQQVNMVVVATAGGGIRAAYWTATVLGAIQDRNNKFRQQLYGISGVSGGSLGATVFTTLLAQEHPPTLPESCSQSILNIGSFECAGQCVLSQDFLGPTVASTLFPDLWQRFTPYPIFPDRARALEKSWEQAWVKTDKLGDVWANRGFRDLWQQVPRQAGYLPALLFNGTSVETGKRVITSNLDIDSNPESFHDVFDFYRIPPKVNAEIRPSTAALNSARFTYVSPAGTVAEGSHLVDGGYFENFGAVTAKELLDDARKLILTEGENTHKIRPLVILISNDPNLVSKRELPTPLVAAGQESGKSWSSELSSPPLALMHTRDARGILAVSELRAAVGKDNYFQFALCKDPSRPDPALGWVLSQESEQLMQEQLRSDACGNNAELERLLAVLAAKEGRLLVREGPGAR